VAAGAVGGVLGVPMRRLLARVPRGVTIRPGPVEVACAVVIAAATLLTPVGPQLVLAIWLSVLLVMLSAVDLVEHRLPDWLTLPAIPISLAILLISESFGGTGDVGRGVLAGAVLGALFLFAAIAAPRAMGMGDVKLVPSLGILLGYGSWAAVATAVVLAFFLGALVAVGGVVLRRLQFGSAVAFGPFLLLGAWSTLVFPHLTQLVTP
jgi:leader peptidase (prepilin peptidase) / N-methyltransferase